MFPLGCFSKGALNKTMMRSFHSLTNLNIEPEPSVGNWGFDSVTKCELGWDGYILQYKAGSSPVQIIYK